MKKITDRMVSGAGVPSDLKTLTSIGDNIAGRTICAFGEACAWPTQSFVAKFPEDFKKHTSRRNAGKELNPESKAAAAGLKHC
tara:strand:+ start:56 stop:304 length:249 start_codon:yes stop_codon:yes gene_type:complete